MIQSKYYIPERFKKAVSVHIIKNVFFEQFDGIPLMLGVHGPSGEGKSFQCKAILDKMNVKTFLISGGQLESINAGEPAHLIRKTYIKASEEMQKENVKASAIIINDFDTGVGDWGEMVQYTVNRQNVFGELMHLVDYPNQVDGQIVKRVPIILTGNDFTKLYKPLARLGRMALFEWIPEFEEKIKILNAIFPNLIINDCKKLIEKLEKENKLNKMRRFNKIPIAFFAYLRATFYDEIIWKEISKIGLENCIDNKLYHQKVNLDNIDLNYLLHVGKLLLKSDELINHLK